MEERRAPTVPIGRIARRSPHACCRLSRRLPRQVIAPLTPEQQALAADPGGAHGRRGDRARATAVPGRPPCRPPGRGRRARQVGHQSRHPPATLAVRSRPLGVGPRRAHRQQTPVQGCHNRRGRRRRSLVAGQRHRRHRPARMHRGRRRRRMAGGQRGRQGRAAGGAAEGGGGEAHSGLQGRDGRRLAGVRQG